MTFYHGSADPDLYTKMSRIRNTDLTFVFRFKLLYLPEQLLRPPLVGGESDDLPDQVPHELIVLGELALAAGGLRLQRVLGGLVTLLQTHADLIPGRHCTSLLQQKNFF
jgi:hypothetical protein